jgi:hypothetical protein
LLKDLGQEAHEAFARDLQRDVPVTVDELPIARVLRDRP